MENDKEEQIVFEVDIQRIIDLLAKQIYQNVYALLRENCQNAYDAILQRKAKEQGFLGRINITISEDEIVVEDNGIGMTKEQLKSNFWKAGASSKNTDEARAAGVVGTFGIGAMANFGIANYLELRTKSFLTKESHFSAVSRDKLSVTEKCINILSDERKEGVGTTIVAKIEKGKINIGDAKKYISDIIKFLDIDVFVNNEKVSGQLFTSVVEKWPESSVILPLRKVQLTQEVVADLQIVISNNGVVWVKGENFIVMNKEVKADFFLRSETHSVLGYRSKFFLAAIPINSIFKFGGVVNLPFLEPTAGREALVTSSIQVVQTMFNVLDDLVAREISKSDYCDNCTNFINWLLMKRQFAFAENIKLRVFPGDDRQKISFIKNAALGRVTNYYEGTTKDIIDSYSSNDSTLVVLSQVNPRRQFEAIYLASASQYFSKVSDSPTFKNERDESKYSAEESAISFRVSSILKEDYFVDCKIFFADLSHGLPILIDGTSKPIKIYFDKSKPSIEMMFQIYRKEFYLVSGFVKDFIRTTIFPKISNFVPSHTRQGAEAFLKAISRPREFFEIEYSDRAEFKSIWGEYEEGKITLNQAIERSNDALKKSVQVFDNSTKAQARDIINDVIQAQQRITQSENGQTEDKKTIALPAIVRGDIESPSKMLLIDDSETGLNGYRCFIAITESAKNYRGEFFYQPHRTEIVWAGQKLLYIFFHHSEEFGFYYELVSNGMISPSSGGDSFMTSTIIIKDQIYIPVPDAIKGAIIPEEGQRKCFEVKYEILTPDKKSIIENK